MFYVDSQRTVTRRDSSLLVSRRNQEDKSIDTARSQTTKRLSESNSSVVSRPRPCGSTRKELISMMFESMLDNIVQSWETIIPRKAEENMDSAIEDVISPSEFTLSSKKNKKAMKDSSPIPSKTARSIKRIPISKSELTDTQVDLVHQCWWSAPDERAIIHFKNGNMYEGSISMKCMHGEGRFQWADGTVYLGQFKNNEMNGKGLIHWKDDTWYQGDFTGNLRHGQGLYVDSRKQRSYVGGWRSGAKHGQGLIRYSSFGTNSYDGEWILNVRHGFGSREYTAQSGYRGEWDRYVREGKGLIIWPNHDFYKGEWRNGNMSGYGIYIWDAHYNNSMSMPSINSYQGLWQRGERNGYGILNLGLGLGSHYKGEFKNNKKHGVGKLVTNNGMIIQDKKLFIDDNMGPVPSFQNDESPQQSKMQLVVDPYQFDICDDTFGLNYHIRKALKKIDKQVEIRTSIIKDYLDYNKIVKRMTTVARKEVFKLEVSDSTFNIEDLIQFEESSLSKALRCYETDLKNIYYEYSTICNTEEIHFPPVLIRLYLWQFYNDCNVHQKGLNLVEIDKTYHQNPEWLSRNPHNPFEKIYFWQFLHSLISVASRLYAKTRLPGVKPDTIVASAFRTFMEIDALPGTGQCKGLLANGYGSFVPLKGAYELYRSIGELHTVRKFLCAVRRPLHCHDCLRRAFVEGPDDAILNMRNLYVIGDEMGFIDLSLDLFRSEDEPVSPRDENKFDDDNDSLQSLKLFNIGNLSIKTIIKIFAQIFPQICSGDKIMDLDVELTFYEFFEAFIACAQESIHVHDEQMRWKEKISESYDGIPPLA